MFDLQFASELRLWNLVTHTAHRAVIFYLFKTHPFTAKKAVLLFVFIQNAPPPPHPTQTKNLRALHCNTHTHTRLKFCIYSKRTPPNSKTVLKFVLIQIASYSKNGKNNMLLSPRSLFKTPTLLLQEKAALNFKKKRLLPQ